MKSHISLLSAVLMTAGLLLAADPAAEQKTVAGLVDKMNAAAKAGDEATLKSLMHDDLIYVHSDGRPENKAEAVAAMVKTKPEYSVSAVKVRVHGNTAVLTGKMVAKLDGGARTLNLDLMMTWIKAGKNWQLLGRHTSRAPQGS
jgi:hypothetical protein